MSKFRKTEKAVPDLPARALVRAQLSPPEPQVSSPFQRVFTLYLPLMGGSLPLYLGSWAFSLRPHFTLRWGQVVLCGCGRRIVLAWDSEYILHSHVHPDKGSSCGCQATALCQGPCGADSLMRGDGPQSGRFGQRAVEEVILWR